MCGVSESGDAVLADVPGMFVNDAITMASRRELP